jgi:hypothetical protein
MSSRKEVPAVTQSEFDGIVGKFRADLRCWYDDRKNDPAAPPLNPATSGAFGHVPDVDSKAVVTASSVVKKHLGVKLDSKLIRRGGYDSFDDLCDDLLPKLRASCPSTTASFAPVGVRP